MVYQLRRIGLPPSIGHVKNVYRISSTTTMIGRNSSADIFLDSTIRKGLISRAHAQIIKRVKEEEEEVVFEMFDTSLNGTYVNDKRVSGSIILKDGDKIAFGHLQGSLVEPGVYAPQKETEFLFMFEKSLANDVKQEEQVDLTNGEKGSVFMSPDSPLPGLDLAKNSHDNYIGKTEEETLISAMTDQPDENSDSEDFDQQIKTKLEAFRSPSTKDTHSNPVHPRLKLLTNPPSSDQSSSENDIKCDTSLNVKHLYKKHKRKSQASETEDSSKEEDMPFPYHSESEHSEEIPDNDSDSDFSVSNFYSPSKTRTRKVKNPSKLKYSPSDNSTKTKNKNKTNLSKTSKNSENSTKSSTKNSTKQSKKKRRTSVKTVEKVEDVDLDFDVDMQDNKQKVKYTHDTCAAWDCKRPSGALKTITWVQCDDCDAWYHVTCSGLSAADAEKEDTNFHCGC